MDKDTYQDNFYLQLVRNVRRYKGAAKASDYEWKKKTVNSFSDFAGVASKYYDFRGDAIERDFYGFDIRPGSKEQGLLGSWYTDRSARNDIVSVAVTHDDENVYFGTAACVTSFAAAGVSPAFKEKTADKPKITSAQSEIRIQRSNVFCILSLPLCLFLPK